MTIHPFQTARYNATPLARHLDAAEPAKQAPKTEAEYAAAMLAEAKQIRARHAGMGVREQSEINTDDILAFVEDNPGRTSDEIAKSMGRSISKMRTKLTRLQKEGRVKIGYIQTRTVRSRVFYINNQAPVPQKRKTPTRDKVIAFMRDNPGCTCGKLAEHIGCTNRAAAAHIRRVRKILNVRTERVEGGGGHIPARYWIEEATT
jgi:predicted ArsR family transcriptional regulator